MTTCESPPAAATAEAAKISRLVAQSPAAANGVTPVDDRVNDGVADGDDEEDVLYVFVHIVEGLGVDEVPVGERKGDG